MGASLCGKRKVRGWPHRVRTCDERDGLVRRRGICGLRLGVRSLAWGGRGGLGGGGGGAGRLQSPSMVAAAGIDGVRKWPVQNRRGDEMAVGLSRTTQSVFGLLASIAIFAIWREREIGCILKSLEITIHVGRIVFLLDYRISNSFRENSLSTN